MPLVRVSNGGSTNIFGYEVEIDTSLVDTANCSLDNRSADPILTDKGCVFILNDAWSDWGMNNCTRMLLNSHVGHSKLTFTFLALTNNISAARFFMHHGTVNRSAWDKSDNTIPSWCSPTDTALSVTNGYGTNWIRPLSNSQKAPIVVEYDVSNIASGNYIYFGASTGCLSENSPNQSGWNNGPICGYTFILLSAIYS